MASIPWVHTCPVPGQEPAKITNLWCEVSNTIVWPHMGPMSGGAGFGTEYQTPFASEVFAEGAPANDATGAAARRLGTNKALRVVASPKRRARCTATSVRGCDDVAAKGPDDGACTSRKGGAAVAAKEEA